MVIQMPTQMQVIRPSTIFKTAINHILRRELTYLSLALIFLAAPLPDLLPYPTLNLLESATLE